MSVYRRSFDYFRPFVWPTILGIAFTLIAIGFNLLKPWPFKFIVDGVLDTSEAGEQTRRWLEPLTAEVGKAGTIAALCATLVVISLLWGLANLASNYLFIRTGLKALLRLRTDLYRCLHGLPLKYHDARRSSDSSFRVAYDSQSIQTIYNKGFATIFSSIVLLASTVWIMALMDWKLTLVSLVVLPFVLFAVRFFAERIRRQSTAIQERESEVLAVAQEGLGAVRVVQAFNRQNYEVTQFHERASQSLLANLKLNTTSVTSALVVGTLMALGTALLYGVGSAQVLAAKLSLGDLLVFSAYVLMLYQPLEQLSYTAWALEGAAAGAQRCFEVLDRENEVPDSPDASVITSAQGEISLSDVSFGYAADRLILRDITLTLPPGGQLAIVGGTGAGKSTLLSLVPRFYDPLKGSVCLDGRDLRAVTKESLRAQISLVLQDTLLFSTSIRENIAYGKPGATDAEIVEAARRAQAYDFISAMPRGFDSPVGERGAHLSVGQRQRIGIARAFLKNAPILLLDEPTSALDPGTERAIMDTMQELMKGRTTIIVTHRLATVNAFDRIIVLSNGSIAEEGSGEELLRKPGGLYASLYAAGNYGR